MVGAAGPLRNGDEVDFMVPAPLPGAAPQKSKGINLAGGGHAVGAVRVQVMHKYMPFCKKAGILVATLAVKTAQRSKLVVSLVNPSCKFFLYCAHTHVHSVLCPIAQEKRVTPLLSWTLS